MYIKEGAQEYLHPPQVAKQSAVTRTAVQRRVTNWEEISGKILKKILLFIYFHAIETAQPERNTTAPTLSSIVGGGRKLFRMHSAALIRMNGLPCLDCSSVR